MQNEGSTAICVACGTTRPGHETEAAKQKAAEPKKDAAAGAFKFGTGDSSTPSSGQLFTFGTPSDKKSGTAPTTGFLFGMPASSPKSSLFSFTSTTNASSSPSAFSTSPGGDRGVGGFKFGAAPEAPKVRYSLSRALSRTQTFGTGHKQGFLFTAGCVKLCQFGPIGKYGYQPPSALILVLSQILCTKATKLSSFCELN